MGISAIAHAFLAACEVNARAENAKNLKALIFGLGRFTRYNCGKCSLQKGKKIMITRCYFVDKITLAVYN